MGWVNLVICTFSQKKKHNKLFRSILQKTDLMEFSLKFFRRFSQDVCKQSKKADGRSADRPRSEPGSDWDQSSKAGGRSAGSPSK